MTTSLDSASADHRALRVPAATFRECARLAATLPAQQLLHWIHDVEVLPALLQERLLTHGHESVKAALAARPDILRRTQLTIATCGTSHTRHVLAANPSLHRQAFDLLVPRADEYALAALARNPVLRTDELDAWAELGQGVLAALVTRPDVPEAILRRVLSSPDPSPAVSSALRNAVLPEDLLPDAFARPEMQMRYALALNAHLSDHHRARLFADPDATVRRAALSTAAPGSPARLARLLDPALGPSDIEHLELAPAEVAALLDRRDTASFEPSLAASLQYHPENLDAAAAARILERGHLMVLASANLSAAQRRRGLGLIGMLPTPEATRAARALAGAPGLEADLALTLANGPMASDVVIALASNSSVVLDARFPVPVLRSSARHARHAYSSRDSGLTCAPSAVTLLSCPPHLDPGTWDTLLSSWEGSLQDLLSVAADLGPADASSP